VSILSVRNTMATRRNPEQILLDENAAAGRFVPGMHAGPCMDDWNKGLKHYVNGWWRTPDGWKFVTRFFPVFVKSNPETKKSFNCDVKNEGGQYVLATLPARDKLEAYLYSIPIWKDLASLPDGLYTWIFYRKAASPVQFAATRTWSALEMGTIHLAIATRVGASSVHGAGEVRKSGNSYVYNLLSGTFTGDWKKRIGGKGPCTAEGLESYIDEEFKARFAGFDLSKTGATLIQGDLPVTTEEIDTYTKAGWTFRFFPTQNECLLAMKTKGGERRRTRRGGALSEAQKILRAKQIQRVENLRAMEANIQQLAATIRMRNNKNSSRPGWKGPSEETIRELTTLLTEKDKAMAKGKGRRVTRRR